MIMNIIKHAHYSLESYTVHHCNDFSTALKLQLHIFNGEWCVLFIDFDPVYVHNFMSFAI